MRSKIMKQKKSVIVPKLEYEVLWIRLNGRDLYLLRHQVHRDAWKYNTDHFYGLYVNAEGLVPTFSSLEKAISFAKSQGIDAIPDPFMRLHDLDLVARWLRVPTIRHVNCFQLLLAWNLSGDLRSTIRRQQKKKKPFLEARKPWHTALYGILWHGSDDNRNFVSWRPWKRHYVRELCTILRPRLKLFRTYFLIEPVVAANY